MSGNTSVPPATLTNAGFVAPSEQEILVGVQTDINAAMGGNANPALSTPQGQLAVSEAAIIGDCFDQFLALANGVDPATASGRMQDAIGYIYFITRYPATATLVQCTCYGTPGVVIPAGTLVQDAAGNTYSNPNAGTIGAGGSVVINFVCTVTGPISVPANTITIYQNVPGWNSVTNLIGDVGSLVESRAAFETRRGLTVAGNSMGFNASVLGAVLAAPGVTDAYVVDNSSSSAQTIGGVSLSANSIYVVVNGGTAAAVGQAIISKKAPGCGYTGGTSVVVADPNPLYTTAPTYTVYFDYATLASIVIAVSIKNSTGVPSNALTLVQNAVLAAFAGTDGGVRPTIGSLLLASRFYAGIAALGSWAQIIEITIAPADGTAGFSLQMNINQMPVTDAANVTLALV